MKYIKYACLATGCSVWWKHHNARQLPEDDVRLACPCGRLKPSRAYLLWACPHTAELRPQVQAPQNRAEERLLAKVIAEYPAAPVVHPVDMHTAAVALLEALPHDHVHVPIAIDGSMPQGIASWSMVCPFGNITLSCGVDGEDQAPYRAEVEATLKVFELLALLAGLLGSRQLHVWIISDCASALQLAFHSRGELTGIGDSCSQMRQQCSRNIVVSYQWVPSHGRVVPAWQPTCPFHDDSLRQWNAWADLVAKRTNEARCRGFRRVCWHDEFQETRRWSGKVLTACASISAWYHDASSE